jgi:hypothetical protein
VDISALAEFVTGVKCTVYSKGELEILERWAGRIASAVDIHRPTTPLADYQELGYYKHLNHPSRWRLRKAIEQSIANAIKLGTPQLEAFGRCVVLRAAHRSDRRRHHEAQLSQVRAFFFGDCSFFFIDCFDRIVSQFLQLCQE